MDRKDLCFPDRSRGTNVRNRTSRQRNLLAQHCRNVSTYLISWHVSMAQRMHAIIENDRTSTEQRLVHGRRSP